MRTSISLANPPRSPDCNLREGKLSSYNESIAAMRNIAKRLTHGQKIALAALLIANVVVLILAYSLLQGNPSAAVETPAPAPDCGALAAHFLAQKSIAGSASIGSDNTLRLHLTGLDANGQTLPQASDIAWDALASTLALPGLGCGPYSRVQVDVPAPEIGEAKANAETRLLVTAEWLDLRAWGYGEIDDGALAQHLETTLYTQPKTTKDK